VRETVPGERGNMINIENYLKLYTSILFCGIYTFFVLACLTLFGYYMLKWVQVGMKLMNRYFERRMRSGHIAKKIKKAKVALVKHFSFEDKKKSPAKVNGKAEAK
jgi:hypothetical protein